MLIDKLNAYLETRTNEYNASKRAYNNYLFFFIPLGDSYQTKVAAANKLKQALNGEEIAFTREDVMALTQGRLGQIINTHRNSWPAGFGRQHAIEYAPKPMWINMPIP